MIIFHDTLSFKSNIYFYISFFFFLFKMNSQEECAAAVVVAIVLNKGKNDPERRGSFGLNHG